MGGSRTFQKLSYLRGEVPKIFLERGDNPEKGRGGGGVDVEMGGCHFFIILQFSYIYCICVGKVKFSLLCFDSLVF